MWNTKYGHDTHNEINNNHTWDAAHSSTPETKFDAYIAALMAFTIFSNLSALSTKPSPFWKQDNVAITKAISILKTS